MQAVVRVLLTLILLIAAGLLSYDLARYYLYSPWTRDARVRANVVTVAPDVSGYVDDIRVRNNQFVHKGDVLFIIDQERYRLALADAEAVLAARHAQHLMLLDQYQRRSKLSPGYTITVENLDTARRQSETATANYQQAIASRDTAALNLRRTEVRASVNGFVTNLNLAQGTIEIGDETIDRRPHFGSPEVQGSGVAGSNRLLVVGGRRFRLSTRGVEILDSDGVS